MCSVGEGEQYVFNVPDNPEVGEKLIAEFKENEAKKGDKFFIITVLYCPRMVGKKWMVNNNIIITHIHIHTLSKFSHSIYTMLHTLMLLCVYLCMSS